ncbi:MAG TPA: hypothetical protein VFI96_07655, partial [Longimicrobiaceae bacterium]|nr:hypothetical protein [Longimicrobiaceae bacterium]
MRRTQARSIRATIAALAVLLMMAVPAAAQQHIRVLTEPGTPVVAVEVMVVAGPADEEPEQAGIAYLSARAVTEPIL